MDLGDLEIEAGGSKECWRLSYYFVNGLKIMDGRIRGGKEDHTFIF